MSVQVIITVVLIASYTIVLAGMVIAWASKPG